MAATFPIPRKLLFYLVLTRPIHGQLYLPCVVLGLGETDRKQQEKLNSRPLGDKKGKKEGKKGYFSPEKRPKGSFVRSFVTSLFAEREGESDFWNDSRKT